MIIDFHKKFLKNFDKLPSKIQEKFYERLRIFTEDPYNSLLNNHSVDSAYPGWRSINITGDYRALYEPADKSFAIFMNIGTHSELYG